MIDLQFEVADLRHLPDGRAPGPALQRALDMLQERGSVPPSVAVVLDEFLVAAARFRESDDALIGMLLSGRGSDLDAPPLAELARTHGLQSHAGRHGRAVVAEARFVRADEATSYVAYVEQLERDVRRAWRRAWWRRS